MKHKNDKLVCLYYNDDTSMDYICNVGTTIEQEGTGSYLDFFNCLSKFCKSCPNTINEVYHKHDVDGDLIPLIEELKELLIIVKGIDLFQ